MKKVELEASLVESLINLLAEGQYNLPVKVVNQHINELVVALKAVKEEKAAE